MKLFIIQDVLEAGWNYHSAGGVVVIAETLDAAKAYVAANGDENDDKTKRRPEITDEEWATAEVYEIAGDVAPKLYVFPDAGCC